MRPKLSPGPGRNVSPDSPTLSPGSAHDCRRIPWTPNAARRKPHGVSSGCLGKLLSRLLRRRLGCRWLRGLATWGAPGTWRHATAPAREPVLSGAETDAEPVEGA